MALVASHISRHPLLVRAVACLFAIMMIAMTLPRTWHVVPAVGAAPAQCGTCPDNCWEDVCSQEPYSHDEGCQTVGGTDFCAYPGTGCGGPGEIAVGTCCVFTSTPIVLDLDGDGFALTDAAMGVRFPVGASNRIYQVGWTAPGADDAWLVLDRDGNGRIENGTELFGNATPQTDVPGRERNGFLALAEFDRREQGGNEDDVIDAGDRVFTSLRLWQDRNHDGISDAGELSSLPALGVLALDLDYRDSKRRDEFGNVFRYRAKVRSVRGASTNLWTFDVILVVSPVSTF